MSCCCCPANVCASSLLFLRSVTPVPPRCCISCDCWIKLSWSCSCNCCINVSSCLRPRSASFSCCCFWYSNIFCNFSFWFFRKKGVGVWGIDCFSSFALRGSSGRNSTCGWINWSRSNCWTCCWRASPCGVMSNGWFPATDVGASNGLAGSTSDEIGCSLFLWMEPSNDAGSQWITGGLLLLLLSLLSLLLLQPVLVPVFAGSRTGEPSSSNLVSGESDSLRSCEMAYAKRKN